MLTSQSAVSEFDCFFVWNLLLVWVSRFEFDIVWFSFFHGDCNRTTEFCLWFLLLFKKSHHLILLTELIELVFDFLRFIDLSDERVSTWRKSESGISIGSPYETYIVFCLCFQVSLLSVTVVSLQFYRKFI